MKFRGNYSYSIDSKGRVMLPTDIRNVLKERDTDILVALPGFSSNYRYLFLLPSDYSRRIEDRLDNLKFFDVKAQKIFTFFYGNSFEIKLDSQGRIRLPQLLLEKNGLKKELIITGEGDFMKLWTPDDYKKMTQEEFSPEGTNLTEILRYINEKYDI